MNFYILRQDFRILPQPTVMSCPPTIDPTEWLDGEPRPTPKGTLRFSLRADSGDFRGAIISGLFTFFHTRFKDDLGKLGVTNIQYFPVELQNPKGELEHKYFLTNVIGKISAVDRNASTFTYAYEGDSGHLTSFKIDPSKTNGQKLFRLAEAPTLIIINEELRNELSQVRLPGVIMLPTERYDGW